jgi:hypothetical protein
LAFCHQQEDKTLVQFYNWFIETVDQTERMYGKIISSVMVDNDKSKDKADEKQLRAKEKMTVVLFMEGASNGFKPLIRDLENDHVLGSNKYPETLAEALQVMMVFTDQPVYKAIMKKMKKKQSMDDDGNPDVSFAMSKVEMIKKGLCFKCGEKGHKASEWPGNVGGENGSKKTESGSGRVTQPAQQHTMFPWMD